MGELELRAYGRRGTGMSGSFRDRPRHEREGGAGLRSDENPRHPSRIPVHDPAGTLRQLPALLATRGQFTSALCRASGRTPLRCSKRGGGAHRRPCREPAAAKSTDSVFHVPRWSIGCTQLVRHTASTDPGGRDRRTRVSNRNRSITLMNPCSRPSHSPAEVRCRQPHRPKQPPCGAGTAAVHDSCSRAANGYASDQAARPR